MMHRLAFAAALMVSGAALAQTPSPGSAMPPATAPGSAAPPPASPPTSPGVGAMAPNAAKPAATANATAPADLSAADKKFVEKAASAGNAELQEAQLAQQKASSDKVKDFAQTMVTDHTQMNQQLTTLAQQKGVTVPTDLSSADQKQLDKLNGLDGKKFDRAYMKAQVKDHQDVLKLLQKEAKSGKDPDLKSFADQGMPTIQKHLQMAQDWK